MIVLDSQLFNLLSVSRLVSPSWMRPISVVSSANFRSLAEGFLEVQSLVYLGEQQWGENSCLRSSSADHVGVLDENFPSFRCCLFVRKLVIH